MGEPAIFRFIERLKMKNRLDKSERVEIFKKYNELKVKMPERYVWKEISNLFHRDSRTIKKVIEELSNEEIAQVREQMISEVLAGKKVDWNSMGPYAINLLFDSLCVKKDLNAAKFVLSRIEKANNNKSDNEESKVF